MQFPQSGPAPTTFPVTVTSATLKLPTGKRSLLLSAASAQTLTEIRSFNTPNEQLFLSVSGSNSITLTHTPIGSATAGQMVISGDTNITLKAGDSIMLRRDRASGAWVEVTRGTSDGLRQFSHEADITLTGASVDIGLDIPADSVIKSVQWLTTTLAVAGGTTVKIGIGVAADPDKYGLTADLTVDEVVDTLLDIVQLSSAEDIKIYACATGGSAGDTVFSAGAGKVKVVYEKLKSLVA